MDVQQCLMRVKAIKDRYKLLMTVPGSGWHDDDPQSPQRANPPKPRLDTYVVRVSDARGDSVFFADDAIEVKRALDTIVDSLEQEDRNMLDGSQWNIMQNFKNRYQIAHVDNVPTLTIWREDLNDFLLVLKWANIGVAQKSHDDNSV